MLFIRIVLMLAVFQFAMPSGTAALKESDHITFRFDEGVSAEDQAYIREGISLARLYLLETLGTTVDGSLIVNARATSASVNLGEVAEATDGYIAFFTGSDGWFLYPPASRVEVAIHEFIHVYQRYVMQRAQSGVPLWMIEGSAEFLASDALVSRGIIEHSEADAYRYWSIDEADLEELVEYESRGAFQQADARVYALAYLGVASLTAERGVAAIGEFFAKVGDGAHWEDAFEEAFGMSPDSFYRAFERGRADFVRRASPPVSFAEIDPVDTESPVRVRDVPESISPGEQLLVKGRSEPHARCIAYLWGESLDLGHETTADAGADLFWLVTIPKETPEQMAELSVNCGADPAVIGIRIER